MKKIICLAIALIMCASVLSTVSFAAEGDYELLGGGLGEPLETVTLDHITAEAKNSIYPTKSFLLADEDVDVTISVFKPTTVDSKTPIAFYVMNFVGADECTDAQNIDCINDLIDQGCVVAVVDFMDDPNACLPDLDWFVQYIRFSRSTLITSVTGYSSTDAYVVPEGYGLMRKVVYFDYEHNAPRGTLENIVSVYNNESSNFREKKGTRIPEGYETAASVYECVKPDTTPIALELMLDIVYPRFRDDSSVVMVASSSGENMSVVSKLQRPLDSSALVRGYTAVVYEHPYVPMARDDHYGYYGAYSYMHILGNKSHAAAVRCVRYYSDTFGYNNENYASMGISKMAMAGVVTNPRIEDVPERSKLGGSYNRNDAYSEQPYLAYEDGTPIDSTVDISYHAMGDGSKYADTWLDEGCAPAILMCGLYDEYNAWAYWDSLQNQYEERGLVYYPYSSYNLGHDFPYGTCDFYGYDRWAVFYDIISYYLEGDREARIAFASIYDGKIVGDVKVSNRELSGNKYVSSVQTPGDELFVQFIAPVTEKSINEAMTLVDSNGDEVSGKFRGMCGGLKWYFEPTEELAAGTYTLKVADNTVKSIMNGITVNEGGEWTFTVE